MNDPASPWKKLSSRVAYENPWIRVREDTVIRPDGSEGIYGVVVTPPSVMIVAVTPRNEVYLTAQHRYTNGLYSWELPAGGSDGQDPLEAARRELEEEAGLLAEHWMEIGSFYPMNGIASEVCHVFLAKGLQEGAKAVQPDEEIHEVRGIPFREVMDMVGRGAITDGMTIAALAQATLKLRLF
jgi:8-oxo-dGTP pyrophosphatase MutT (NUDIX family)